MAAAPHWPNHTFWEGAPGGLALPFSFLCGGSTVRAADCPRSSALPLPKGLLSV